MLGASLSFVSYSAFYIEGGANAWAGIYQQER